MRSRLARGLIGLQALIVYETRRGEPCQNCLRARHKPCRQHDRMNPITGIDRRGPSYWKP